MNDEVATKAAPVRTGVAPLLSVRRGAQAVEFYKLAFGATEVFRIEDPSGAVVATLAVDGGGTARLILTVSDPDAMFARAVAAGARVVTAMTNAYGWRLGRVADPFGHHWEIGRPLK